MGTEGIEPPSSGLEPGILPLNDAPNVKNNKQGVLSLMPREYL